jgi:hypothetical protein
MTPAAALAAVRTEYGALTETQAKLVALAWIEKGEAWRVGADLEGGGLDPELPGDAAELLRAEVHVANGVPGSRALARARREHLAYCEACRQKPVDEPTVDFDHFIGGRSA